jgi:hypothetical protein
VLLLTPDAAEAVERVIARHDAPPSAGLRLSADESEGDPTGQTAGLRMALVAEPEPEDHRVHSRVFVEAGPIWQYLEDKVLDAELAGRDEIRFRLRSRLPAR